MSRQRVIVIGGGLSGISAALECVRRGIEVILLEARGRLGGAVRSVTRTGLCLDTAPHLFLGSCTEYRRLLVDLGTEDAVALHPRRKIPLLVPDGSPARLSDQNGSAGHVDAPWELFLRPPDRRAADIGYARGPASEIHDEAARRALTRAGVEVRLRRSVTALSVVRGGFSVEVNLAPTVEGDAVILALPPERAARLLPRTAGIDPAGLLRLRRSPIVNLHIVFDRPVLDVPFAAAARSPVQWVLDRSAGSGVTDGQYLVVSLAAGGDALDIRAGDLQARYLRALGELLPDARGAEVLRFYVTLDHFATFRSPLGPQLWRPPARTALPGLVVAGAWADTSWPGTMEGAVRSGRSAVRALLDVPVDELTVPPPPIASVVAG